MDSVQVVEKPWLCAGIDSVCRLAQFFVIKSIEFFCFLTCAIFVQLRSCGYV